MKKVILNLISLIIVLLIISISILSSLGIETNKFNSLISDKAAQTKKVFFCTCKQTEDPPLCDGSHNKK